MVSVNKGVIVFKIVLFLAPLLFLSSCFTTSQPKPQMGSDLEMQQQMNESSYEEMRFHSEEASSYDEQTREDISAAVERNR